RSIPRRMPTVARSSPHVPVGRPAYGAHLATVRTVPRRPVTWSDAVRQALYGHGGFFHRPEGPAGHFRTSVHASPLFAGAVLRLIVEVDRLLGAPAPLDLVDVGAGRGELLTAVRELAAATPVANRLRLHAVELA